MKLYTSKHYCILFALLATLLAFQYESAEARIAAGMGGQKESEEQVSVRRLKNKSKKPKKNKKKKDEDSEDEEENSSEETPPDLGGATGGIQNTKPTIGLAIAGGAIPAAIVGAGILRGFQRKTIMINGEERPAMEGFDYTAGLSGGNVPQVLYAYAPGTTSDELLDASGIGHPSEITTEELENIPDKSIFSLCVGSILPQFAYATFVAALFPNEDFMENLLYKRFLEPFGVPRYSPIGKTRDDVKATPLVMTSVVGAAEQFPAYLLDSMRQKYSSLLTERANMFTSAEEVPEFTVEIPGVASFDSKDIFQTLLHGNSSETFWELAKESSYQIPYGAFISPDELTIPMQEHQASYDVVGNVTVDPIDFVPVASNPDDLVSKESIHPFTLAKMFAVGTNFLVMAFRIFPRSLDSILFKPNYIEIPVADGTKRKVALSDGGYNTDNGVPSLVKKGVRKIICNIFLTRDRLAASVPKVYQYGINEVTKLFGIFTNSGVVAESTQHLFDLYSNNENQVTKFIDMVDSLYNAGEPLIVTLKDLDVVTNKFWGIKGGGKVDLTVIMNLGVPKKFSDQVPREAAPPPEGMNMTDSLGFFTNPELKYVPNMYHAHEPLEINIPALNFTKELPIPEFANKEKETRMTEILCSWMIEYAWDGLVGDDGEIKFEGFKTIFEEE